MRNYKEELDVDFIGEQRSLTKEEESAISAFIKANKESSKKSKIQNRRKGLKKLVKQ